MRYILLLLLCFLAPNLDAQLFGGPARRLVKGPTLPAACTLGDIWFDDDAAAGSQIYACTATDTWTLVGGGGGGDALTTNPLSQFAATTSAQLAGVITNETGTGLLVLDTSPTIITPTIASFANATHNHTNAAGGGQLGVSSVSATGTPSASTFWRGDNTWATPSGGAGTIQFQAEGVNVGSPRDTLDRLDGTCITSSLIDTGTKVTDEISVNTAVCPTGTIVQSGSLNAVTLSSSGTDTFVGTLTPALTGYPATSGVMRITFRPNFTSSGATTLALNGLAALNIYESDGTTNASLTSGSDYELIFDTTGADMWKKVSSGSSSVTATNATGTVAALPSCDASRAQQAYHFTNASFITHAICDGVSAWHYYMKGQRVYPVTAATFGTALGSGTTSDSGLAVKHVGVTHASHSVTGAVKAIPASTYSITAVFAVTNARHATGVPGCGLIWRESATGDIEVFPESLIYTIGSTTGYTMTSLTGGFTGLTMSAESPTNFGELVWYRLNNDDVNRSLYWSRDGVNWRLAHSEATTTAHFAGEPDQVGIACNPRANTTILPEMLLISWQEGAAI